MPSNFGGINLSSSYCDMKYHSGFTPGGIGFATSATSPNSQGKNAARIVSKLRHINQTTKSLNKKFGKNGTVFVVGLPTSEGGIALPCFCTSHKCSPRTGMNNAGKTATWSAKKRCSATPPTFGCPDDGS